MIYRRAVQCYDERWEDGDPDRALCEAIRHLDVVSKSKRDADWHQFRGLCLYELDRLDEEAEDEFRAALRLEPDHQYARLYLGHSLFDQDRFAEALEQFEGVQEDFFAKRHQGWRILKNDELRLCCKFHLSKRGLSFAAFENLCQAYETFDPIQAPVPTEIVACIETLVSQGRIKPEKLRRWVWRLQDLMAACGINTGEVPATVERLRLIAIAHLNLKPSS